MSDYNAQSLTGTIHVTEPTVILFGDGDALACDQSGELLAEEMHGFFVEDTRVLSTYQIRINGHSWHPLGYARTGHGSAIWEFENPEVRDVGGILPAGALGFTLRRRLARVLHDDLSIRSFLNYPLLIPFLLELDADFADIFQVQSQSIPPRLKVHRITHRTSEIIAYEHRGFRRAIQISFDTTGSPPVFIGTRVVFELDLKPGEEWKCCLQATPIVPGKTYTFAGNPHEPEPDPVPAGQRVSIESDSLLARPFERGFTDLYSLAIPQQGHPSYVAAGIPWFMTLFGRDSLLTSLMAALDGSWLAEGALAALAPLQATTFDDWLDAQPGRILHEVRHDELTELGELPYKPAYYGTYDAPELYCLTLWNAWRWTGERGLLEKHIETARKALHWCDELGDMDRDGLLEYITRSPKGLRNQSWKDSGVAVVYANGALVIPPCGTVELQGYWFAARLAMAEMLSELGEVVGAEIARREAKSLRPLVEERYWMEDAGYYAFALDYKKSQATSIASNPGQLLWCGLPSQERAKKVVERIMQPDMFSGWGVRTLSSEHVAYNPLAYQLGSIWPHDTILIASGFFRYGFYEEGCTLIHALLEAANAFEQARLPELFCGFARSHGPPVPYRKANRPQAWAAASAVLAAQLFLGLVPDAPRGRLYVSPWLPEWLPRLRMQGIRIGHEKLDITVARHGAETVVEQVKSEQIKVIQQQVEAPLWGKPMSL